MSRVSCDSSSGLVDLICSPGGSQSFYRQLVPRTTGPRERKDLISDLTVFCLSYGVSKHCLDLVVSRGFISKALLALLPVDKLEEKFPEISSRDKNLLRNCISSLDHRPEYQVSIGLGMLAKPSSSMKEDPDKEDVTPNRDAEITAALELAETARKLLECPVCYQTCRPPRIWQCTNGHLTCDMCHHRSDTCPLCRSPFTNIRPFTAEKLARQVTVNCKNKPAGCQQFLPWQDKEDHESKCEFATGNCPILSCLAQFLLKDVLEHLQLCHNLTLEYSGMRIAPGGMIYRSQISTANYMHPTADNQNCWWGPQFVMYQTIPFFFVISRKVDNFDGKGQFYFWVWLGGKSVDTRRFLYTVTLEGGGGERISYTAKPESIETGVSRIREEQSCLMVSDLGVKRFLTGSEKILKYSVEIIDKDLKIVS